MESTLIQTKAVQKISQGGLPLVLAIGALLCSTLILPTAWADTETGKITESFRGSRFGQDVAISNDIAVVGASEEFDQVSSAGAGYIYRNVNGNWQREARLTLDNKTSFDRFGWSVAASGNVAVVGSNGSGQNVVGIYQFDGGRWNETTILRQTREGTSAFGGNVAASGDVVLVGAPSSTVDGAPGAGSAFIYRFNGATWQEEAALSLDVSREFANFGAGVAIHGDLAVVGAPEPFFGSSQGSVHVYRFDGSSWVFDALLTPDGDRTGDSFGVRVAVSANTIIVGSPRDDSNGEDAGSAYVFRFNGTEWSQEARITPSDGGSFEFFGSDVALADDVAIISSPGDDDNGRDSGSAYEFRYDGTNWTQASKLTTSDADEIARLGGSVSISGDVALIGASGDDENGFISGAAYTFDVALDTDGDGVAEAEDNCPSDWNPLQENFDGDLFGDVCDLDDDNDGLDDDVDPLPLDASISTAPIPVSPSGDNIPLRANFEWAAVLGASRYAIEVQHEGQVRAYEDMIMADVACSDGRCRFVKPDAALEGMNRWRLRAGTSDGTTAWSAWTDFVVNANAEPIDEPIEPDMPITGIPALPQVTSPLGSSFDLGVDFRWSPVPGATNYSIEVQHNGDIRGYALMIDAALLCADGQCVYTKTDAALPGLNRWRLKAGNAAGNTTWTPWAEFTVAQSGAEPIVPSTPVPRAPTGSVANPNLSYQWATVVGATQYAIEIQHNGEVRAYDEMIFSSTFCSAINCQYIKSDAALIGENRWRLRAGSTAGFSPWSEWFSFVVE